MQGALGKSADATDWLLRGVIALLACAVSFWIECATPDQFVRGNEAVRDAFLQISAADDPETRLSVVDIGEAALGEIGPWPWPRSRLADLADTLLGHYGARAVAFDVVFPEPSDEAGDARLAALASSGRVVLAQILDFVPRSPVLAQGVLSGGDGLPIAGETPVAHGFIANHAGLSEARCVGNIGYVPDIDGVLRRLPIQAEFQGRFYSHLALVLLDCVDANSGRAQTPFRTGQGGSWRVPYRYAPEAYSVISAEEILRRTAPRELVEGRYLLVGSSALGLGDRVSTPLSPLTSGVMVHAESLSGLLDAAEGRLRAEWSGRIFILVWTVASVFAASMLMARLSPLSSILLLLSFVLLWLGLAYAGVQNRAEGSVLAPLFAYLVLLVAAVPHEWWRSQRTARRLLDVFSHYVARPVLNELIRQGSIYSLKPTLRDITVLVADMEGYTRMTSSLSLDDAATLTKDFLDCLTRPVLARQGTLDKYTGDGLVVFWGAPLICPDQADQAVAAALEIVHEVDALNTRRAKEGFGPVLVRIGIESGRALVGDLGTSFRSTYTAVGDCINFASRLEAAARNLHVQVVIGPVANQQVSCFRTLALGRHMLRGTSTEIDLFSVEINPSGEGLELQDVR